MLLTGPQAHALADFADGGDVIIATAIFDPEINPMVLVVFRDDGEKIVIHRDGSVFGYNGELELTAAKEAMKELPAGEPGAP